ncbi:hypothetical protein C2S51_006943 [Perilla frutescens var. frutescens]|nr:hypothetical protein C2S51_006943 [Perilla frutescens var. frutescens]
MASDVEEQIKNAELSGHKKRKREVEEWLRQVKSIDAEVRELGTRAEGIITRLMDGGNAAKLNEQVEKLVDQSRSFGDLAVDVCGTRGVTLLTTGMVGEAFEENIRRVLELLETGDVSSIRVQGMGGAGKTTLAKHIHNRLVEQSKWTVVWVTVSREFSIKSLQDKIARFLGVKLLDEDEEDIRAGRLYGVLSKTKNVVVILDDVWENINLLKVGCPFSLKCCRLIITSRSLEVCRRIGCEQVIAVEKQIEDDHE